MKPGSSIRCAKKESCFRWSLLLSDRIFLMSLQRLLQSLFFVAAGSALAHPLDMGLITMENQGNTVDISFELNPVAAARLIGVPPDTDWEQPNVKQKIHEVTLGVALVESAHLACRWNSHPSVMLQNSQLLRISDQV